jgi:hypothetical protein
MVANPPAVTVEKRRAEYAAGITSMVGEALEGGGERAAQFRQGMLGRRAEEDSRG